jgi:ATP-binding cassette subfamily B protein
VRELNNPEGIIRFKDVTFHYPKESDVLKDFNVEFRPNMKIAIVGSSGGGKTTIFNLLTRLFDPIKGKITIDGVNISSLTETSLRNNISIIRQDPFIFNKTILENFLIIDDSLTLEEIRHYCKLASIDDYIMTLPKKYNTLLGEGGVNLSGGQKQRLAIARTLVKKSKIILFDEATSALDNETQDIVKDTITHLVPDHTILIIAHRLETIIDADIIYVIDNGKVVDAGTHKQLLKRCKYYKKLYHDRENKTSI